MTKYIIYAEDDNRPGKLSVVRKIKNNEFEALNFINDMKNLCRYGCMTVVRDTDGIQAVWNAQTNTWEHSEEV